jgi:hypothetical protein
LIALKTETKVFISIYLIILGCNGGLMDYAFEWIEKNGIPTEDDYKYTARDGKCKKFTPAYKNLSFTDVPTNDPK